MPQVAHTHQIVLAYHARPVDTELTIDGVEMESNCLAIAVHWEVTEDSPIILLTVFEGCKGVEVDTSTDIPVVALNGVDVSSLVRNIYRRVEMENTGLMRRQIDIDLIAPGLVIQSAK